MQTKQNELIKDSEGNPRQFHIIKTRSYGKKKPPTMEAENGPVTLDTDTLTDDPAVADHFRGRGHQVRHFGTLTVSDALKYAKRESIQVYGKTEGLVNEETKFTHGPAEKEPVAVASE